MVNIITEMLKFMNIFKVEFNAWNVQMKTSKKNQKKNSRKI